GNDIKITVTAINGNQVRIGISAPKEVKVLRQELVGRDKEASGNVL
ncbi:MAG: carbon storage regulator, partial [Burkholderiaceae bacterium]